MGWIAGAWRGEEKLWKVFWIYGALFGYAVGYFYLNADGMLGLVGLKLPPQAIIAFAVYLYPIWLIVTEWRSAFNTDWQFFGYAMRLLVILQVIALLIVTSSITGLDVKYLGINFAAVTNQCASALQAYHEHGGKDAAGFVGQCMAHKLQTGNLRAVSSLLHLPKASLLDENKYRKQCVSDMVAYAQKMGLDPQQYVSNNLAYVEKCTEYHQGQDAAK